ncbi:hypothetical protein NLU14_08815 [Marinobacter sp. 71-i]|uniref:CR-type domain-containing protein n=1 Tax=Marinobacter iranensis TaxID=2962607 RepID=A0ABT5Y9H0_9GAMM|nr:zinc finger domain-containing protein [Marinobacter iranensis]MDF0750331.1 hypothetical protein [Marinobacter iranensis]
MKININDFIGKSDPRVWMREPIQVAGKLAATDGRTVFSSNESSDLPSPETASLEKIEQFLDLAAAANFSPMPELTFPEMPDCADCKGAGKHSKKDCPECDGEGEAMAETAYHEYEVQCRMCDGDGQVDSDEPEGDCQHCNGKGKRWTDNDRMKVEGIPFDMNPALMLRIADVPGMQIAPLESSEISRCIAFKCADGIGIIMGMRDKP